MKSLFLGILAIILIGVGGFLYRNAMEHPPTQITACTLEAKICPDGTSVGRQAPSCEFSPCASPNVSLASLGIAFAVPEGFSPITSSDAKVIAAYESSSASSTASIFIRSYPIPASTTPLTVIQQTALGSPSDMPVSVTSFSSTVLGTHRFTVVSIERFEGVIDTAFYLARGADVLRFDAIDRDVTRWTDPNLNIATLPAALALRKMLGTLQGQ